MNAHNDSQFKPCTTNPFTVCPTKRTCEPVRMSELVRINRAFTLLPEVATQLVVIHRVYSPKPPVGSEILRHQSRFDVAWRCLSK